MKISDSNILQRFLNGASYNKEESITGFPRVGEVYKWTNEFFDIYPKNDLENKKVLTVTGSGDHALDAIYKGAKEIDSIDINIFAKYVSALKIAMIKSFDFTTFSEKYEAFTNQTIYNCYSIMKTIDNISPYLSKEELLFWTIFTKQINVQKNENGLFYNDFFIHDIFSLKENNNWFNESNYYDLKEKLSDVKIKYYDSDITHIKSVLDGKIYDFIYLSNILDKIKVDNDLRYELINNILSILNNNGSIYSYHFNVDENIWDLYEEKYVDLDIDYCKKKIVKNYRCFTDVVAVLKKRN